MAISEERTQHRTLESGRLRFVLGERSTDVALPAHVPLADLLPAVLSQFGAECIEQGADHEGWVAQRIGEPALDEDRTLAELGLLDGETVHLRPRADELAPIDYDDLVDGVGEQVQNHSGSWTAARTRWMLRSGGFALLLLGLPLLWGIPSLPLRTAVAGGMTVLLLGVSVLVARGAANPLVATILAGVATCYAASTGAGLMLAADPVATSVMLLTCACAAALVVLVVAALGVADSALLFTGAITLVLTVGVTALIGAVSPVTPQQAAAIGLVLTLIASLFLPSLAFRMSGLTLPLLPTNANELTEEIEPVPHQLVVERGALTTSYAKALHVGLGAAQSLLLLAMVPGANGWMIAFLLGTSLLLFLRARHPNGMVQRWSVLVPAGTGVVLGALTLAAMHGALVRLLGIWLPTLAAGALLLVLGEHLPGRRLRPYWGRAVDILESLTAVAVLPLLFQLLGVYTTMWGLFG